MGSLQRFDETVPAVPDCGRVGKIVMYIWNAVCNKNPKVTRCVKLQDDT